MSSIAHKPLPPTIKLLSEHLDMVLAAGEDLTELAFDPASSSAVGAHVPMPGEADVTNADVTALPRFVAQATKLEAACIMRVFSARARAEDLINEDARFAQITRLFLSGILPVVDETEHFLAGLHANEGGCPISFLQTRGLIAEDCAGPDPYAPIAVTQAYLIAGAIELGMLMDLAASFLDQLEIHFEIFPALPLDEADLDTAEATPRETRSATLWAPRQSLRDALAALKN